MAVNQVKVNDTLIVDMTNATASASDILNNKTAYLANGELTVGTGTSRGVVSTNVANSTGIENVIETIEIINPLTKGTKAELETIVNNNGFGEGDLALATDEFTFYMYSNNKLNLLNKVPKWNYVT